MVRRPAAVLIAVVGVAQGYVLLAPVLPELTPEDLSLMVARACGAAAIVGVAWALARWVAPARGAPSPSGTPRGAERASVPPGGGLDARSAWVVAVGAGAAVAVLALADVGAAAAPSEAVFYAAVGAILALGLLEPALVLSLPLVVAVLDVVSTVAGGPSQVLANAGQTQPGDPLSLEMPDWGNGLPAGRLGLSDVVVAGVLLVWASRCGLRAGATAVGLWAAVVVASGLNLWLDAGIPTLPLFAVAFYAVNSTILPSLPPAAKRS